MKFSPKFTLLLAIMACVCILASCATATPVPRYASDAQIQEVNALNLEAIAKNTSTLAGFLVGSLALGILIPLIAMN